MSNITVKRKTRQFVTMYAPIFREKLEKLERRGHGHTDEAQRLRNTLLRVGLTQAVHRSREDAGAERELA